jgi:hypothetical protein
MVFTLLCGIVDVVCNMGGFSLKDISFVSTLIEASYVKLLEIGDETRSSGRIYLSLG